MIVKPIADKSKLPPAIATEFKNRFTTRFYSVSRPFSQAIAPTFEATDSWLVTQLTLLVPAPNSTATPNQPDVLSTRASEGLSLHLDTLAASPSAQQDSVDTLRGMIGYCILLRDETLNGPWCCLNLAYPTTSTGAPAVINLTVPVVVPNPQHIQDQMRRSIVTYNSQPLMAQSPTHGFSTDLLQTQADVSGRMISYIHPSVTEGATMDPTYKIPGLVFGHKYRFLIGRVGNSGALPPSFAALGQPAQLSFSSIKSKIPASAGTEVQYLRTVPVADLRFQSSLGSDTNAPQKIKLPAIPPDVQPRARELYPSPASANSPTIDQPVKKTDPLILLTNYMPTVNNPAAFMLYIQKPTVDLLTWDRWRAKDIFQPSTMMDPINIERVAAWDRFHVLARSESTSNSLSLDDPAVTQLKIEVDIINADGSPNPNGTNGTPATITWGTGVIPSTSSNRVQDSAAPIAFTAIATNATTSKFNPTPTAWDLQLAPGAVARVKFTATVPQGSQGTALFGKGIYQEKTYTFLVEAANQAMPKLSDLRRLFKVTPPLTRTAASLDFSLSVDALPTGYQIRRATLQTQVWRWDGRPAGLFPFDKDLVVPDPAVLEWEVNAFATRLSTDVDTRPMTLASVLDSSAKPALTLTAHDDLTTELGALYYRSSIEVFNRYGSLVPTSKRSISTFDATQFFPGGNAGWTRTVVKSRIALTLQPPKPAIKFILPLTGTTAAQQSSAASVLVVIQGPWYALAGLAEDMGVRITSAGNNSVSPGTLEVGPDPIVWHGNSVSGYLDYPKDPSKPPSEGYMPASGNPRFHGPVGHTFDTSDTNPLWVNTSFVLDAPPTAAGESMPWTFAEVSFCRIILKAGILPDLQGKPTDNLQSAWTDPVWVEFLPSRFNALGQGPDLSSCKLTFDSGKVAITGPDNKAIKLVQTVPDAHLIFVLLLTGEVPDLLGRKGQERYHCAYTVQSDPELASWTFTGSSPSNPVGRILGIERKFNTTVAPPLLNAKQLWAELFPPAVNNTPIDSTSRIVSISPPVQASSLSCAVDSGGSK